GAVGDACHGTNQGAGEGGAGHRAALVEDFDSLHRAAVRGNVGVDADEQVCLFLVGQLTALVKIGVGVRGASHQHPGTGCQKVVAQHQRNLQDDVLFHHAIGGTALVGPAVSGIDADGQPA